jgi:hypothetical protein
MYEMIMTNALDANACLTPRGVTVDGLDWMFLSLDYEDAKTCHP